jgi:hypothetical protein
MPPKTRAAKRNGETHSMLEKGQEIVNVLKDFIYGMAFHGMARYALKTRMYLENLFLILTLGDMIGIPILPPYYSLKLLPYMIPNINNWRRSLFKERDFTDSLY